MSIARMSEIDLVVGLLCEVFFLRNQSPAPHTTIIGNRGKDYACRAAYATEVGSPWEFASFELWAGGSSSACSKVHFCDRSSCNNEDSQNKRVLGLYRDRTDDRSQIPE